MTEELKGCPNPECGAGVENIEIHNYVRLDGSHYFKCNCNKCGTTSSFWMNKTLIAKEWNELQVHIPIKQIHCGGCGASDYSFYALRYSKNHISLKCNNCHFCVGCSLEYRDYKESKKFLFEYFIDKHNMVHDKIDIDALIREEENNDS